MIRRAAVAISALLAVIVGGWGIVTSYGGLPEFSWRVRFISELAVPRNPRADLLNASFVWTGALVMLAAALMLVGPRTRLGRAACIATGLAGLAAIGVGIYPLTDPWKHLVAALLLGAAALTASPLSAIAVRRVVGGWPGRLALAAMLIEIATAAVLVAYFLYVSVRVWPGSVGALFRVLPRELPIEVGGDYYNPLAVTEWLFFAVLGAQFLGTAALDSLTSWAGTGATRSRV